jgi:hypothetical protein
MRELKDLSSEVRRLREQKERNDRIGAIGSGVMTLQDPLSTNTQYFSGLTTRSKITKEVKCRNCCKPFTIQVESPALQIVVPTTMAVCPHCNTMNSYSIRS